MRTSYLKSARSILLIAVILMSGGICHAKWTHVGDSSHPIKTITTRERRRDYVIVDFIYNHVDSTFTMKIIPPALDLQNLQERYSYPVQITYIDCAFRFNFPNGEQSKKLKYRINTPTRDNINEIIGKGYFEIVIDDKDRKLYDNLKKSKNVELPYYNFKYNVVSYIKLDTRDF